MKNNKSMILLTSVLMTSFLLACGKSAPVSSLQQPTQLVSLSVDPCPPNCDCRPETKVQGGSTETADANDPVVNAPVVTKISTKTADAKTPATATPETKSNDDVLGTTPLPEISPPPAADTGTGTTDGSTTEKPKTKVGQLIDKIKNIFKKKS